MDRRTFIGTVASGVLAIPLVAFAQQPAKVWRIGYLSLATRQSAADSGQYDALLSGMREFDYVEGKNLVVEARFAGGNADRLDGLAAELVRLKVDVILTSGSAASRVAQFTTAIIPIVVISTSDPVRDGFAATLARPGGNITGMAIWTGETIQKCIELLRTMVPKLSRVAVMVNPGNAAHSPALLSVQLVTQGLGMTLLPVIVRSPEDLASGFATMAREHAGALIILADAVWFAQRQQISTLALKYRLPSIGTISGFAEAGILVTYASDLNDNARRAATFVDKILKGAKPGELPFELPTRYYLVVNRGTAKSLGIAIPQELMLRADRVIE